MKKTQALLSAVALIATAGAIAAGTSMIRDDPQAKPLAPARGSSSLNTAFLSKGNLRALTITDSDPTNGIDLLTVSESQQLLVRQLTISNGWFTQGIAEEGGLTIQPSNSGGISLMYPFSSYNAQQFHFDPPLSLESGSHIYFTYRNVGTPTGVVQAVFWGEAIPNATGLVAH